MVEGHKEGNKFIPHSKKPSPEIINNVSCDKSETKIDEKGINKIKEKKS